MANEPTKVTLLDQNNNEIFSVAESHPESINNRGSEKTRSVRIEGPVNCVVTCFDDQQFRPGQNSVQLTKVVADPVVVPIAQNFVQGQRKNGVYLGSTPTYKWQLNKAIKQDWWDKIAGATWDTVKDYLGPVGAIVVEVAPGVEGFVNQADGTTSDNNHVDNLSSLKFGN